MRILLDTNIFLWVFLLPSRVSTDVKNLLKNPNNDIYLSAASAWEIAIKYGIGKIQLPDSPDVYVTDRTKKANFKLLEITFEHSLAVFDLPQIHKDPFDRLLIAQTKAANLTLLSADKIFTRYEVDFIDADAFKA